MSLNELLMSLDLGLIYGIIAIGIYLSFRILNFTDLTCDGSFVLGSATSSILIKLGFSPILAIMMSCLAGGCAGLVTAFLNLRFKINDLLSGILVAFMLYSLNLRIMGGQPNLVLFDNKTIFTGLNSLYILSIISISIILLIAYLLQTDFGLGLRSIGQNKRLAVNNGISIPKMTLIGLSLSNGLIAFGGGLFSQHQEFSDVGSGFGTIIIGLASIIIGEKCFQNRSLWVSILSCVFGSILYRLFISIALHSDALGLESSDLNLITGLLITSIMILS
nr:hypothetical protein [Alphaproteobacteria bacterium]